MTLEELKAIEERAAKAAEGPWTWSKANDGRANVWAPDGVGLVPEDDADFIAHARTDVPALCAEIRRLKRVKQAAREYLSLSTHHDSDQGEFAYDALRDALDGKEP